MTIMSHKYVKSNIDFNQPRSVWALLIQLFYTLVAMTPMYYYLRELVKFNDDAKYVLMFLPIVTGILLYFVELKMNLYYWNKERIFKKRDIFTVTIKSFLFVIIWFYILYFFMFGYWFSTSEPYKALGMNNQTTKSLTESLVSIGIIAGIVIVMDKIREGGR